MPANRRTFLTAAALTALAQRKILGANDRIRVGAIGTGGRGRDLLRAMAATGIAAELAGVCDVYAPNLAETIEKFGPSAKQYADHRQLLDDKEIDAVIIASPDHWHVPMVMDAIAAGKDVYVEKPVTHTIDEGDKLIKAVRATNRIVQCGMQQRSWEHFQTAAEMIQAGKLGKVTQVRTYWFQNYGTANLPEVDMSKLDWKRWLGSAPDQPFDKDRFFIWRWYWDFGGGAMTDLLTHWIDVVHMAMKHDSPTQAHMLGRQYKYDSRQCPDTMIATFEYPGFMVSYDGTMVSSIEDGGLEFRGSQGTMKLNRGRLQIFPEGRNRHMPEVEIYSSIDGTTTHMANFLECARSRKQPTAPVEVGVAAVRPGHLANLSHRREQRC